MSRPDYEVVVVGGGPAGSAAAIHLAAGGHRVLLLEKAVMPREKLCGEFLSTEVASMCRELGVLEEMRRVGARRIRRLELTEPAGGAHSTDLAGTALSLSRRTFDHLLFERAGAAGAHARDGEAVRSIEGGLQDGFHIETSAGRVSAHVVLGAYGRRDALDRRLRRPSIEHRSPYVGFKARHAGRAREETIELHAFPGGYCGLVGDENGAVNVCWLSRVERLKEAGGTPDAMIEHVLFANPRLRGRLEEMQRTSEFMAVGQLSFRRKDLFASDVCMIGDAAGMIAPLCGDGIGMALRSAEVVAPLIDGFLSGDLACKTFRAMYRRAWTREFSVRMTLGRRLNDAFTHPLASRVALAISRIAPATARAAIAATRG